MEDRALEDRLTPAARSVLDEVMGDMRGDILAEAARHASQSSSISVPVEISVGDVVYALETFQSPRKTGAGRYYARRRYLLTVLVVYGLSLTILSLAYFTWQAIRQRPGSSLTIAAVTVAVIGVVISLMGVYLVWRQAVTARAIQERFEPSTELDASQQYSLDLVQLWRDLEIEARTAAAKVLGESKADEPISKIVHSLVRAKVFSDTDAEKFLALLRLRNAIIHEGEAISEPKLKESAKDALDLMGKLRAVPRSYPKPFS